MRRDESALLTNTVFFHVSCSGDKTIIAVEFTGNQIIICMWALERWVTRLASSRTA